MDELDNIRKNAGITEAPDWVKNINRLAGSESDWSWDIENDFNEKVQYVSLLKGGRQVCRIPAADFESIVSDFGRFLSSQSRNEPEDENEVWSQMHPGR